MESAIENTEVKDTSNDMVVFQLFIADNSPASEMAKQNIKAICEKYLPNRYTLEIININEEPTFAIRENIITIPVLIKKFPLPVIRMAGDLSDTEKVLKGFYLPIYFSTDMKTDKK